MANKNLTNAKKAKNDEFYTQLSDIEKELQHYAKHFKDKIVYLNCDTKDSNFFKYFYSNQSKLGIKKILRTSYSEGVDFRSKESIELLKEADIVVTNPPFSLFREFIAQLTEHKKEFLVIGSMNAITYKEIFKLIKSNQIWLGIAYPKNFKQPDGSLKKFGNINWYTNLEHHKRNEKLILHKKYDSKEYPTYDNYDAIEVSRTNNIPKDYSGFMGVPISFLSKYNPNQFEILGCSYDYGRPDNWDKSINMSVSVNNKNIYKRLIIKHK